MRTRTTALTAFAAAAALTLASCDSAEDAEQALDDDQDTTDEQTDENDDAATEDDDADAAADGDESLSIICSPAEELCDAWAAAFEDETGVATSVVRQSAGDAAATLSASSGGTPEYDVWHGGTVDAFISAIDNDLLAAYDSPNRSELDAEVIDEDGYWSGIYVGALGFCSNEEILDEIGMDAPESWDDLLDPGFEGEVMMAHPASSGTAYTMLYSQVERLGGEEEAFDYLSDFNANVFQYTQSGSAPATAVGDGEAAVSIVFAHDCITHQEQGYDLTLTFPEEGTGHELGAIAMIAGTENESAAQQYIDWALTPAAQDLGPEVDAFQVLTHPDAADDERMVNMDDITLLDYDFAAAGAARDELSQRFDDEIAEEPAE